MILKHFIKDNTATNIEEEEESFVQRLCAMIAWQEFVEKITREQMLDLFENAEDVQELFKASCNFVHLFSKVILNHLSNLENPSSDTVEICINQGSIRIKSEGDLRWYAGQGQNAIEKHFKLISKLLNSQVDPRTACRRSKIAKGEAGYSFERDKKYSSAASGHIR